MICYNVKSATDAFDGLAESLDAVSRLPLSRTYSWARKEDRERNIENIANIIDLYPDADRIRGPFERAIEIADTARDEETVAALHKLYAGLQAAHEKFTRGEKAESEYKAQLTDVAASVRGLRANIAEDGTKRTDTAQTPAPATVKLVPEQATLLKQAADHAERAAIEAEKAANKPTTVINAHATVTVAKPPRMDAGGKHKPTPRGWRTQSEVAVDFSKSEKKICNRWYGKVTVAMVKDWETRYPDETKRERKSGYHAGLRNEPNPTPETKKAYYEAAANWNDYWVKHNAAFLAWLKGNPKGDHATFLKTWERPGKTVHRSDTDKTKRYGADTSLPDALDSGDFDNKT